jgi:hypothetical protein
MAKKNLEDIETVSFADGDFQEIPPGDIVAYNELRSCADLYRMYDSKALDISPNFQRDVVWKAPSQTRFIDSLIKQLPIPSLCFSYSYKTEEWQVIDGLQRISTIIRFLDPKSDWVLSTLPDVDPRISGALVTDFHKKEGALSKLLRRIENASLPITVLRCDPSLETHSNYLFTIFHRLNTGGMKLNNQEIRNCIFSGDLNNLLKTLDNDKKWLKIHGLSRAAPDRFRRQEIVLRFFAFHDEYELYTEGLARFLNNYMRKNRNANKQWIDKKKDLFAKTVEIITTKLSNKVGKQRLNLAFLEALLVGVGRNATKLAAETPAKLGKRFDALMAHEEFTEGKLLEGLSKTARVQGRLNAAVKLLG